LKTKPCLPEYPRDPSTCKIAFIGEAPGDEEAIDGRPFRPSAPSGKLFNRLLARAGILRTSCLVTNLFDTQLPNNEVKNLCDPKVIASKWENYNLPPIDRGQYLRPAFVENLERLSSEIRSVNPNVVVPLGGTALWAFTGFSNISLRRGAVIEASMCVPGIKVLPTFHPAFLLHSYGQFPIVVADLLKAKRESSYPDIRTTPREIWLEPSLEDLYRFKETYLDSAPYISIDIETPYLKGGISPLFRQIKCIGFSDGPSHAIVVPFIDERKPNLSYWQTSGEEADAWKFVRSVCESAPPKLGQNFGIFDAHWLWDTKRIRVRNYVYDTRLEHHALYPELSKDLGTLSALYANETAYKVNRTTGFKRDE
jgi:uracil-DNA glycosylase